MQRSARQRLLRIHMLCVAVSGTTLACGTAPTDVSTESAAVALQQTIINGERSGPADFPATGIILATGEVWGSAFGTMLCTGTLIAPDVVLAAAHCTEEEALMMGMDAELTYYFSLELDVSDYGVNSTELPDDAVLVAREEQHPDFSLEAFNNFRGGVGQFHDISILFLDQPITHVKPAVVMGRADDDAITVGADVQIVGYGQRDPEYSAWSPPDAGVKYHADSLINEVGTWEMQIGKVTPTPQKCHGDSGGPTYMSFDDRMEPRLRVVGVTSHGYSDENCYKGGVDTRVDPYLMWIDMRMMAACDDGTRSACDDGGRLARPTLVQRDQDGASTKGVDGANSAKLGEGNHGCRGCSGARTRSNGVLVFLLISVFFFWKTWQL